MLEKNFDFKKFEPQIYKRWLPYLKSKKTRGKKEIVFLMAPPNITGALHLGHALENTLVDILVRYYRMSGFKPVWLPGTDHASIATHYVVEKELRQQGLSRLQLGRLEFLKRAWAWREKYGNLILEQFKRLGITTDWSRVKFTLDQSYVTWVERAFVEYYKKGLAYRDFRPINFCSRCQTSLSDLEIDWQRRRGNLYYIKYLLKADRTRVGTRLNAASTENDYLVVATTRPETMLGDVALAVNLRDERYKAYIGRATLLPLIDRELSIIADRRVEPQFGTGVLKITPAHSLVDFEISQRHSLPLIQVINEKGELFNLKETNLAELEGYHYLAAREKIVAKLKEQGLLEKIERLEHEIPFCDRCKTELQVIPLVEWFIKMKGVLAGSAQKAVATGKVNIIPIRFKKPYFDWLKNIRDWCVSRKLWWGQRMPVWYRRLKPKVKSQKLKVWNLKIYGEDIFEALKNGTKTIELRAGKPKTDTKFWGNFKIGDEIIFQLADESTDALISSADGIKKIIKGVRHFKDFETIFKVYQPEQDYPGKTKAALKKWWFSKDIFKDRIAKYGFWVFELANPNEALEEIYVGLRPPKGNDWVRTDEVFDTWFSSALWPFATLYTKQEQKWYPAYFVSCARDILHLWITRMIYSGLFFKNKSPFQSVFIHPTVLTKTGQRMSKSLGTGIDPLDLIDCYGADALRFGLIWQMSGRQDLRFDETQVEAGRKFANKVWNACRFYLLLTQGQRLKTKAQTTIRQQGTQLSAADKKIIKEFNLIKQMVEKKISQFEFSAALQGLYRFFWHGFCDVYLESCKGDTKNNPVVLQSVLAGLLTMLNPFMPFITEALWQKVSRRQSLLLSQSWPSNL